MEQELKQLKKSVDALSAQFAFHEHTGTDNNSIMFDNLKQKKLYISHFIADGTDAANYGVIFTAPFDCVVSYVSEVHQTAGTNGGAVTLQLEKLTGTQALDAGGEILSPAIDLKATANTVTVYPDSFTSTTFSQDITSNKKHYTLKKGDRLALKDAGTLTDVAGINVVIGLTY